jgi:hypothetical protein
MDTGVLFFSIVKTTRKRSFVKVPPQKKSQQLTDQEILLATWNVHSRAAGYKTLNSKHMMLNTPVCYAANQSLHKL